MSLEIASPHYQLFLRERITWSRTMRSRSTLKFGHHHTPKLSCNMVSIRTSARINLTTLQQNIGSELLNPNRCLPEGHLLDEVSATPKHFWIGTDSSESKGQRPRTEKLSWHRPQTGKPVLGTKLKVPFGSRILRFVRFLNRSNTFCRLYGNGFYIVVIITCVSP